MGNPVFPIMINQIITINGYTALLNDIIEFGVNVKPKSLNALIAVQNPHHVGETPSSLTTSL